MAAQLQHWADEEMRERLALPAELNNVLSSLWSGLAALALALFALVPMIAYDWQQQGALAWAGEWQDWVGPGIAGALVLLFAVLGGWATALAVKAQPRGLTLTRLTAILALAIGAILAVAILVLVIQGQFKLGPTPILAGTLLVIISLLPVFLAGLTLSLATVEGVREYFYPPEEVPVEVPEEEVEAAPAGVSEEELERSLGELPTGQSAPPPVTTLGEVIRAELDESRLIRAELDTEAGEIIRAELDEERLVRAELDEERLIRAELDEERLIRAEPASSLLSPTAGPASDIFQAEPSPRIPAVPGEVDIERIGDTSSRVLSRGEPSSESPSAILLSELAEHASPSDALGNLLQPSTPSAQPPLEAQPAAEVSQESGEPPLEIAATPPAASSPEVSEAAIPSAEPPAPEGTPAAEEIFSAPSPPAPSSETSAIDLEHLSELEVPAAQAEAFGEPETPVHLPSGEPAIEATLPPQESPAASEAVATGPSESAADHSTASPPLFAELADLPPPAAPPTPESPSSESPPVQPLPPSEELFREVESSAPVGSDKPPEATGESATPSAESTEPGRHPEIFPIAPEPDTEIRWHPQEDE